MKNKIKKIAVLAAALTVSVACQKPVTSLAFNVTPISVVEMYSTSATPVYATPDVFSPIVVYLDRFVNVRVTGITGTIHGVADCTGKNREAESA